MNTDIKITLNPTTTATISSTHVAHIQQGEDNVSLTAEDIMGLFVAVKDAAANPPEIAEVGHEPGK